MQLVRKLGKDVAGPRVGGAAPATPRRLPVPMDLPIPFDANGLETVSMALQNRMMTLVAFLQAQNCSNLPGSWRHPATMLDFLTPEYYQRIAGTLEARRGPSTHETAGADATDWRPSRSRPGRRH